jgi:hypothetical protein
MTPDDDDSQQTQWGVCGWAEAMQGQKAKKLHCTI